MRKFLVLLWSAQLILLSTTLCEAKTLHLNFGPEVSFNPPDDWTACDTETRSLLGAPPPTAGMKKLCDGFDNKGGAIMTGNPEGTLALSLALADESIFPTWVFLNLTQQKISALSDGLCTSVLHMPKSTPCVFELDKVDGRTAITGYVSTPNGQFVLSRVVLVPADDKRTMIFIFVSFSPNDDTDRKMRDMVESIHFQKQAD